MENKICINNIYTISKNMGIKIGELEESVGLSKGYLARLKRDGESFPAVDKLYAISKRLNVSMDSLMDEEISEMAPDGIVAYQFLEKLYDDSVKYNITWAQHKFLYEESGDSFHDSIMADSEVAEIYRTIERKECWDANPYMYVSSACFYTTLLPGINMTIVLSRIITCLDSLDTDWVYNDAYNIFMVDDKIEEVPGGKSLTEKVKKLYSKVDSDIYVTDSLRNSMKSYLKYDFSKEKQ